MRRPDAYCAPVTSTKEEEKLLMPHRHHHHHGDRVSRRGSRQRFQIRRAIVESLEVRSLLSTTFTQTNLVSDIPGTARTTDPNLVNASGITLGTNSGLWIAENGT